MIDIISHKAQGCLNIIEIHMILTLKVFCLQTISFLVYLQGSGQSLGPHLILSPLSVMGNWQDELKR